MEQKSKVGILSVLIALIAMLLLISSIALVEFSQSKKASVENLIDPFEVYGTDSGFRGTNIQVFNGGGSSSSNDDDDEDDDEAPGTITGLTAVDIGTNHIYWTWTNPADSDFYMNRIYLNGIYQTSTSNNYYNATGLASNTTYTITVHTMDDNANVNTTDVNDTQTTLSGGSSPDAPVITPAIPNMTFDEDTSDNTLILDNYVTDPDTPIANLVWSYAGNTNIVISIDPLDSNRVTFSAPADWNGAEIITFRVEDPETNWDDQAVTVTVNPVDDPAVWNALSDQSIPENSPTGTIVYADIISECSDIDSPLTISVNPNTNFVLGFDGTNLILNSLTASWNGVETVTVTCNGVPATFDLTVTTSGGNTAPTLTSALPDQTLDEDTNINDAFNLESYFDDAEDGSAGLIYTVVLQTNAGIVTANVDGANNVDIATIANRYGTSDVTIRATDSGGLFVEDTFRINVNQLLDECVWVGGYLTGKEICD